MFGAFEYGLMDGREFVATFGGQVRDTCDLARLATDKADGWLLARIDSTWDVFEIGEQARGFWAVLDEYAAELAAA